MDNICCLIGIISLVICFLLVWFSETSNSSDKDEDDIEEVKNKKTPVSPSKFIDTYNYVVFFATLSVLCFIAFGVVLYFEGHMF